jgi:hypothetical protein
MARVFVPLSVAPEHLQRFGTDYLERRTWLVDYIHERLGFVRGTAHEIWIAEEKGWWVTGEVRDPQWRPRAPGTGRFLRKEAR